MFSNCKEEWTAEEMVGLLEFLNPGINVKKLGNATLQIDTDPRTLEYPSNYGYHPEAGYIYSPTTADAFSVTKFDCTCW